MAVMKEEVLIFSDPLNQKLCKWGFPGGIMVKNPPTNAGTQV